MTASAITVAGLTTTPGAGEVGLTWTYSDPRNGGLPVVSLDAVEVHAATSNDRSLATKVAEGLTSAIHTGLPRAAARYYWIKPRDKLGNYGAWYPVSATAGVSGLELIGSLAVPTASNLVASGGVGFNSLTWDLTDPNSIGLGDLALDLVEVHAAATNDRAGATKVAEGKTFSIQNGLARGVTRYYWVRPKHVNGTYGAWFPSDATSGVSATEQSGNVSLGSPGYWQLPNGLIFQWGIATTAGGAGQASVTFPIAFPNGLFEFIGTVFNNNALYVVCAHIVSDSLSGGVFLVTETHNNLGVATPAAAVGNGTQVNWMAFGY